jgi:hypothetical protein
VKRLDKLSSRRRAEGARETLDSAAPAGAGRHF